MKLKQKKVLQVAQEITFARALASNDKSLRERALRRLKKWFLARSNESQQFSEEGFMRIWKGLFYCIWMSDKPLVQEENVDDVSCLVHCFNNFKDSLTFTQCFYQAMSQAWFGLDQHRLDKFMMLVRRLLRQSFEVLARRGWKPSDIEKFSQNMYNSIRMAPIGMSLHITEIYLEELAKVGRESLETKLLIFFLTPFGKLMGESSDPRILSHISSHIFLYLIRQSDEGIKEQIKFNTWRDQGFPGGTIDMMEEMPNSNDVDGEKSETETDIEEPLDPRAGHVDVLLPSISFDHADIINLLTSLRYGKDTTTRAKKSIASLIKKFKKIQSGEFPLGLKKVEIPDDEDEEEIITEAVESLIEWEKSELELDNKNKLKVFDCDENKCKGSTVWEITPFENNFELSSKISLTPSFGKWDVTPLKETSKKCMKRKFADGNQNNDNENNIWINSTKFSPEKPVIIAIENVELKRSSDDLVVNNKPETRKEKKRSKKPKKKQSTNHVPKTNRFQTNLNKHSGLPKLTTPNSVKRVAFSLSKNMSHEVNEYKKTIKKQTSLPYDAERKPIQGVLKSTPVRSPINPFYKR